MKSHFFALSLGMGALLLATDHAFAQQSQNCAEREKVVTHLAQKFGETRRSIGLGSNNAVVEIFASEETGSWSLTVTLPNGQTCMLATGHAFETITESAALAAESDA